jgi:type IV pilus assembly protein PilV
MNALPKQARERGFSLVEVMVAVVVICVGLLGIAKMQALALSNTNTSRLRSLAAIEAASLAAAMHSNRNYWGNATGVYTVTPAAVTSTTDGATAGIANAEMGPPPPVACENGNICDAQNLAAYDLAKWAGSLGAVLPNPQATVTFTGIPGVPAPPAFTITITWNENAVAMMKQETGALALPTYTLYVEP